MALLPFVDERRLINALELTYHTLTPNESKRMLMFYRLIKFVVQLTGARNSLGCDYIFVHKYNTLYAFAKTLYENYQTPSDDEIDSVSPRGEGEKM